MITIFNNLLRIFMSRMLLWLTTIFILSNLIIAGVSMIIVYENLNREGIIIAIIIAIVLISSFVFLLVKITKLLMRNYNDSEKHYPSLFENHHVCMLLIDPSTQKIADANSAACKYLGYKRSTIVSMALSDISALSPYDLKQNLKKAKTGQQNYFSTKNKLSNGEVRDVEITADLIEINGKKFLCSIITDITERKRAEEALRESEENFRVLFDENPLPMVMSEIPSGRITFANKQMADILGMGLQDIMGKTANDLGLLENPGDLEKLTRLIISNGYVNNFEIEKILPDGSPGADLVTMRLVTINGKQSCLTIIHDITERKLAERALSEGEDRFRKIIEEAPIAMAIVSMEGVIEYINHKAVKVFGYQSEDIPNMDRWWEQAYPDEDYRRKVISEWMGRVQKALMEGTEILGNEYRTTCKDGTTKTMFISGAPVSNKIFVLFDDVTERKKVEEALRESEERFSKAFRTSPYAFIIANMEDGNIIEVNDAFTIISGFSREEALANSTLTLKLWVNEEDRQRMVDAMRDSGSVTGLETKLKAKNGKVITALFSARPIQLGNRFCILSIVEDITERRRAEEALHENEDRFRMIVELAPIAMAIVSMNGVIEFINHKAVEVFGYLPEDIPNMDTWWTQAYPDEGYRKEVVDKWMANVQRAITEGKEIAGNEFQVTCKDGTIKMILISGVPVSEKIFVLFDDITDRKQVEIELIKAKEKAEESDRLKTAFLQNMSHEIRTPMNAIMGFSSLLVENYDNKPKLEQYSQIINLRCNDLLEIINDILDIAKIESGQLPIFNEVCNLNELFAELTDFFQEHQKRIGKQHVKFSMRALSDPSENVIVTDKIKLKQIFINLIFNAFKFTDTGQIEGGCKLDAKRNLVFYVSDTGIGIPPDKFDTIFERFAQLYHGKNLAYGGTGLGLSIVKGLVELMDGKIWLESELESRSASHSQSLNEERPAKAGGTTFYFSLPYKISQLRQHESVMPEKSIAYDFNGKTILIVEDDIYNTTFIQELLSATGMNILHTEYGHEAVQIAKSQTIDLVLMDVRLPDMNGYEAAYQIKQHKPNIRVIVQTAYASPDDKQKALDAGFNGYISKPLNRNMLLSLINKHLQL